MKKLLFLGACLVALASQPAKAQTGAPDVVVARIMVSTGQLHTTITRGPNKTEESQKEVPLNSFKYPTLMVEAYQQLVVKLMQEGYTLKGMSGGDASTVLIFTKGQ